MKLTHYTTPMLAVLLGSVSFNSMAEPGAGDSLQFGEGSKLSVEASPGFWVDVPLQADQGLVIGSAQNAAIDKPFHLFGQLSQHQSAVPVSLISADGNTVQLDFSGWTLLWNKTAVTLGGVASVSCESDCSSGDNFSLDYSTTIPAEVEFLGGLAYRLQLEGAIE